MTNLDSNEDRSLRLEHDNAPQIRDFFIKETNRFIILAASEEAADAAFDLHFSRLEDKTPASGIKAPVIVGPINLTKEEGQAFQDYCYEKVRRLYPAD